MKIFFFTKALSVESMLNFSDVNGNQEETESVTENGISDVKEIKMIMKMQVKQNMFSLKIP